MKKNHQNYLITLALLTVASLLINSCKKEPTQNEIDKADIIDFVDANQLDGQFTSSGLWYMIIELGSDIHPTIDSILTIDYNGYLLNGNNFDSKSDYTFKLKDAVPGLQEGLQLVGKGGEIKLILPSVLAYGPVVYPDIPANSVLVFDISVKNDSIQYDSTQAEIDKAAIVDYIEEQQLDGQFTDSGLYYVVIEPGSANHPNISSEITVDYYCYRLNGDSLDSGINNTYRLHDLIYGWQEGLQLIGQGGEIILIIPSDLAYGSSPTNGTAYSILVFEITLTSFTN